MEKWKKVEKSGKKVENNFWPEWNFFLKKIKKWKSGKVETQVESGSGWNFQLLPYLHLYLKLMCVNIHREFF
jgi:hypothetical protein